MIHCIGDSHSCIFSGNGIQPVWPYPSRDILPYFRSYRIGPATATHNINKFPVIDDIINKKVDKNNDMIFFVFGEVNPLVS